MIYDHMIHEHVRYVRYISAPYIHPNFREMIRYFVFFPWKNFALKKSQINEIIDIKYKKLEIITKYNNYCILPPFEPLKCQNFKKNFISVRTAKYLKLVTNTQNSSNYLKLVNNSRKYHYLNFLYSNLLKNSPNYKIYNRLILQNNIKYPLRLNTEEIKNYIYEYLDYIYDDVSYFVFN